MGGLVGGFYATGKPVDQLQEILRTANWPLLLGGGTPYEDFPSAAKKTPAPSPIPFKSA